MCRRLCRLPITPAEINNNAFAEGVPLRPTSHFGAGALLQAGVIREVQP